MSLKIYSGIRFASADFYEVFAQLQSFRARIEELTIETCGANLAARITRMVDDTAANGDPLGENFLSKAAAEFRDELDEVAKTGRRNAMVDFDFKVEIMPHDGKLYGMVFTEQSWRKELLANDWVSDFGFWDSTDKPETLSDLEWEDRERIWEGILAPDHVPAKHGVEMNLTLNIFWPEWEWIEPRFHSFDERLRQVGEGRASHAYMRSLTANASETDKINGHAYMEAFFEARRWLKTEEGEAAVIKAMEDARPLLPPVLTREVVDGSAFSGDATA